MSNDAKNVLFLCTGNSARSIMAEAALNFYSFGRFKGFSAGSYPTGKVNPHALATLEIAGIPTTGLRSKSWDEFAAPDAPEMDFVFTVCDDSMELQNVMLLQEREQVNITGDVVQQ